MAGQTTQQHWGRQPDTTYCNFCITGPELRLCLLLHSGLQHCAVLSSMHSGLHADVSSGCVTVVTIRLQSWPPRLCARLNTTLQHAFLLHTRGWRTPSQPSFDKIINAWKAYLPLLAVRFLIFGRSGDIFQNPSLILSFLHNPPKDLMCMKVVKWFNATGARW